MNQRVKVYALPSNKFKCPSNPPPPPPILNLLPLHSVLLALLSPQLQLLNLMHVSKHLTKLKLSNTYVVTVEYDWPRLGTTEISMHCNLFT